MKEKKNEGSNRIFLIFFFFVSYVNCKYCTTSRNNYHQTEKQNVFVKRYFLQSTQNLKWIIKKMFFARFLGLFSFFADIVF